MIASLIYLVIYLIVIGVVIWLLTLPPRTDIASSAGVVLQTIGRPDFFALMFEASLTPRTSPLGGP